MSPQRTSFQPSVGRSIPFDLLQAMPGHWQLRELAGAYVNGNGRCLNVSSECRRPRAASAFRCHPVGSCDDVYYDAERKRIYALVRLYAGLYVCIAGPFENRWWAGWSRMNWLRLIRAR